MTNRLATLRYGDEETQAVDLVIPGQITSSVGVFLVHGGSWYRGSREMYHPHLETIAADGHLTASVGYRLDPSSRLGDKMRDIAAGYQAFRDYLTLSSPQVTTVVVAGGSAGAHLASLLVLGGPDRWNPAAAPFGAGRPAACLCWYGPGTLNEWPDMDARIRAAIERLCGTTYDQPDAAEVFTLASPITYVGDDPSDFLFLLAEQEDLFPHEHVYELAKALGDAGAATEVQVVEGTRHGFMMLPAEPPGRTGMAAIHRWLSRYERSAHL